MMPLAEQQLKVVIFSGEDEKATSFSSSISSILAGKVGINHVTLRSTSLPADRILSLIQSASADSESVVVFAVVDSTSARGVVVAELLRSQSVFPAITLSPDQHATLGALEIARVCGLVSASTRQSVGQMLESMRQASLVDDAQIRTKCSARYGQAIEASFDKTFQITGEHVVMDASKGLVAPRLTGKVRDRYEFDQVLALVTTDRQSGFDRMLALVPFKGAVLNLTSAYWFETTKDIVPNHLISVPHPNVSIVKKCTPFPIEFVVRSYVTGSTSTSIWKNYQDGVRNYCGHELPEGLKKNQKLWKNLLTPTTKEEEHDRPISSADIVTENWMTQEDLDECSKAALAVFARGQEIASKHGLILVDTKYEFGKDANGTVTLIDEVHTPDSSRYWLSSSYQERIAAGLEPENIDKEFLRLWFRDHCDPYKDEILPEAPKDLVVELARRYVSLYEMITWKDFEFETGGGESMIGESIQMGVKQAIES